MTRHVIALFSQSFPRRLPPVWRTVWRTNIARWMEWLLAAFVFILPWFAIPHWFDALELPKALLGVACMCAWFVLRGAYSVLGSLALEEIPPEPRRWSVFSLWVAVLGVAAAGAWFFSAHPAISLLGNGTQVASSFLVVVVGLWLVVAVRDAVQRAPQAGRFLLRSWVVGTCIAIGGALLAHVQNGTASSQTTVFSVAPLLDLLIFIPVLVVGGLALLTTRATIEAPLTWKRLVGYQLSHALLTLALVGLLGLGLVVQLGWSWVIILLGSVVALIGTKQRRLTLASFISLLAIACSLFGLVQIARGTALPTQLSEARRVLRLESLSQLLPNQRVSWKVVSETLQQAPLFGAGPGAWISAFDQARPLELNQTPLWNLRFPRAASALTTFLTEYGLLPAFFFIAFCFLLLGRALRTVHRTRDLPLLWYTLLFVSGLVFAGLHPMGVFLVLTLALSAGFLATHAFGPAKIFIPWSEHPKATRVAVTACALCVIGLSVFALQRAAAAELLVSPAPYALPLARRLNRADDFTFAREAQLSVEQAARAFSRARSDQAFAWLDRADKAIGIAMSRNPRDPEHVSIALQSARLRAEANPKAEEEALALAAKLDELRPTDPSSPLAVFGIQRAHAAREARWVEQGQGREKEEALERETQAKRAADEALAEALRRKSDYLPALYAQAAWQAEGGKTNEAIATLEALVRQNPASPELLMPLALLHRRNQAPEKAVSVLQYLVQMAPAVPDYQWQLSLALVQAERWDEATFLLQRLVAAAPQETVYQTQLKEVLRKRATQLTPAAPVIATSTTSTAATSTPVKRPAVRRRTTR